ncbi:hypothetical protein B0H19DRAFT_1368792 [Mycena capillaripes]|nr:hypothetical protein B0H19DRAFT_1368792 [Mycena capillaripes]
MVTSLFALALAVTGAVVTGAVSIGGPITATWAEAVNVSDLSSIPCLGSDVSASRINLVKSAIASGNFVLVPDLPLAKCGSAVVFTNTDAAGPEADVTATAIGDSHTVGGITTSNLGLGPAALAESASSDGVLVYYTVKA